MKLLPTFAVRRPVMVAMSFLVVLLFGFIALSRLPIDLYPEIEPPVMSVITVYPGASATDVEMKVTDVIEDSVSPVNNIVEVSSISKDNLSVVTCRLDWDTDLGDAADDIRGRLEMAKRRLPPGAEPPTIFKFDSAMMPVLIMAVTSSEKDVHELRSQVETKVAEPLQRIAGVGSVQIFNEAEEQVIVDLDRKQIEHHKIPIQQIGQILAMENLSVPAGYMRQGDNEYTIRLPGEFGSIEEIRNVIVGQGAGGIVRLEDIAHVHRGIEDIRQVAEVNGSSAMILMIQKQSGANTVEVVDDVLARSVEIKGTLPSHMDMVPIIDTSQFIRRMVTRLTQTLIAGFICVMLVVFLFLRRIRTSVIVGAALPTSLISACLLLYFGGFTLNVISIAAIIMAIGMVVDNAIVVIESISRQVDRGLDPAEAAAQGTSEVSGAVMASTVTTLSIFVPLILVSGLMGIMFKQLSYVISITLIVSLIVSMLLTPMLASKFLVSSNGPSSDGFIGRLRSRSESAFTVFENFYSRLIERALRNRWKVVITALVMFGGSLLLTSLIGLDLMPSMDSGEMQITFEMPIGTSTDKTSEVAREIVSLIEDKVPECEMIVVMAGAGEQGLMTSMGMREGPNIGKIILDIGPVGGRAKTSFQVAELLTEEIGKMQGISNLQVEAEGMVTRVFSSGEAPLTIEVLGEDLNQTQDVASRILAIVKEVDGTTSETMDTYDNRPEIRVKVDRVRASRLGLSMAIIGDTLRTGMYGKALTRYRGQGEDLDIFLRFSDDDRMEPSDIENMTVASLSGAQVRLGNVATVGRGMSPIEIRHKDRQRVVRIMADVSGRALGDVAADVERLMESSDFPPTVTTRFAGDVKEQREAAHDLLLVLLIGIFLVYVVMASLYESLIDPLVIMFAVPFAFTGVLLAFPMTGTTLSLSAMLGGIMLVGIVVNNAIIIVDHINQIKRTEDSLTVAIQSAGARRLRPILMTTFTTIFGMLPMAIASGEGSQIWKPMGIAIIGGLLMSTMVTLVLIPAVYSLLDPLRRKRI